MAVGSIAVCVAFKQRQKKKTRSHSAKSFTTLKKRAVGKARVRGDYFEAHGTIYREEKCKL